MGEERCGRARRYPVLVIRSSINLFSTAAVTAFASLLLIATQTRPFDVGVKTGG